MDNDKPKVPDRLHRIMSSEVPRRRRVDLWDEDQDVRLVTNWIQELVYAAETRDVPRIELVSRELLRLYCGPLR